MPTYQIVDFIDVKDVVIEEFEEGFENALTKGGQEGEEFSGIKSASNDDRLTGYTNGTSHEGFSDADGFMKLGDIKGEFAPSRQVEDNGDQVAQFKPGDVRDHNHGNRTNWDVICDLGTAIKQTSVADALSDYRLTGIETGFGHNRIVHPSYRPEVYSEGVSSPAGYTDIIPAIALRSDNRFVIEPVKLFQGLDAGGVNYAEAVGLDSSTVDVGNKVISSLQPANEFI